MTVYAQNINEGAHTTDLRCSSCGWTDTGVNANTGLDYVETVAGLTIKGNVTNSVANVAALPDASGLAVDTIYHVVSDDADGMIEAGGARLYRVVDDGGKVWRRIDSEIKVPCGGCPAVSSFPMYDPGNISGTSLGKAKTNG
jgi:hypothetical protein